jgi:hypothetical protein
MNLTQSPVWDTREGFGGNGNLDLPTTIGHGRCVSDGPFSHLEVQYYSNNLRPHCLSRGFLTGKLQDRFGAQRLNDTAIAAVLNESDYFDFLIKLEEGPHLAIPINVRGDFSRSTAPNGMFPMSARETLLMSKIRSFFCTTVNLTDFGGYGKAEMLGGGYWRTMALQGITRPLRHSSRI